MIPVQLKGEKETPDAQETLAFWRSINNEEVVDGRRNEAAIREVLPETREKLQGRLYRWERFTEEFDEVLRCTAPWKACGVDSAKSFSIKKCPQIKKTSSSSW